MHEQSLANALVREVIAQAQRHRACRVQRVVVRCGVLACSDPDRLREHFVQAARGTLAEGAVLDIIPTDDLIELVLESLDVELTSA